MSTVTSHAPSYTSSSRKGDALNLEPDKEWKDALRAKIEAGLSSMVQDAKKNLQDQLEKEPVSPERREELTREYHQAMTNIRALAEETYQDELERERQERRWASGEALRPEWNLALQQEQQHIMDRIKGLQKESSSPSTAEPPEGGLASEAKSAEMRPKGLVPVELPPDLAQKRERQQREEQERKERDRNARERQERERQERLEKERKDKELREAAQREQERREREREEKERQARERQEQERLEREKLERERQERERQEKERLEKERQEKKRQEGHRETKELPEWEEKDNREREWQRRREEGRESGQEWERGAHSFRNTPSRRGSVTRYPMNSREDYPHPPMVYRQPSHPALAERYARAHGSDTDEASDIDEETLLRPPTRHSQTRKPSIHERQLDPPLSRSIEHQSRPSSERYAPRSPPNPTPQIWKPSSPEEDIASTRPPSAGLARRNSTTSIRSTGSAGHRPAIAEPILERSDSEAEHGEEGRVRVAEPETSWSSISSKAREKDKRREHRKSSASDQSRFDDVPPTYSGSRPPYRPEDIQPLPPHGQRDRYDDVHPGYGIPRPQHRPDDAGARPPPTTRSPTNHKTSHNSDEWEHPYPPGPPPRSVKPRGSFDDRAYLYSQPPTPAGRVVSRPPSIPSEERERYYDQPPYRPYPTPPSSASRSTGREYTSQQGWYSGRAEAVSSYPYGEPRSNTYKYAQQADNPKRRSSESRPTLVREPSFTKNLSEEPYQVHPSPSDSYPRPYDVTPSASIPIARHRPPPGVDEPESWKSWANEVPPHRRDSRRDSDRRGGYGQYEREDGYPARDQEYNGRYEIWERDQRDDDDQYYYGPVGPPPEWGRRDFSRQVRSPSSSYPGSYHETGHLFGGREARGDGDEYELEEDYEVLEQDKLRRAERPYEMPRMEGGPRPEERPYRSRNVGRDLGGSMPMMTQEDSEIGGDPGVDRRMASAKIEEEEKAKEKARKLEEEAKQKAKKLEEEAKRKAEEAKMLEEEAKRKAEEAKILEEEARRKAEEAKKFEEAKAKAEEEAKKLKEKEEEIRRKELETKKKADEVRRKEEEAKKKEAEAKKKEAEARKKEAEARKKEAEARRKEQEAKRKEEEARKKEEEAGQKEREARRREEEAHTKEEEARKKEEEIRQREEELRKREEELTRREQEMASQKEAERLQREWELEEEERRLVEERTREELERFRIEQQQQEEFRRREQEIRQRAEERKRQDSVGAESTWSPSSYSSTSSSRSHPQANGTDRNGQAPGWTTTGGSAWTSSTKSSTTTTSSTSTASSTPKPRSGSINSTFPTTPSPHPPSAKDESEWKRRQEEHFQKQQERFREEQERLEHARQRAQSSVLSKEEVVTLYDFHERQWALLASNSDMRWGSVPWPMFKPPKSPEDITAAAVSAYMQSPYYPDKDKSKTYKDRLKDHIKKWHPDRFETKYLPRFVEEDRERVKEGAGSVARTLSDLLMRANVPNPFS
ncbi:hypothetical protein LshimejAT787_0603790 [Lyophyllum shimeji]|uniref:Uncharacterized protein n=1 Tax=Lyophyllum shimeji TaxID=47721 RepID=A0A9P3PMR8_LYOSH|nr:hypothetical protein LshimejAT787_0603790 [Lyophyllum shimeji]